MERNKLAGWIESEKSLGRIVINQPVGRNILSKIKAIESYKKMVFVRLLRITAIAASVMIITVSAAFFNFINKGERILLVYPYNGESSVELAGSFNGWEKKIQLTLDKEKGVWKTQLFIKKKGVYEYQFIIDGVIYTAGDAEYKITDRKGNEKAILSI